MFAAWGRFVYRNRWAVLVGSGVLLAVSIVLLAMGGNLQSGGPLSSNLESAKAQSLINTQLNTGNTKPTASFDLIFKSDTMQVSDPAYQSAVTDALAPVADDSRIVTVISPYTQKTPQGKAALTSKDGHEALVVVDLDATGTAAWADYTEMRGKVHSNTLQVTGTGFIPINKAFNTTLESDLQRAELVSLPVTLILLVIIFAGLVAAGLPLGVGLLTIAGGVGGTFFLNRFTDVSQYALNIVTLIGLGVSIDYSLFIVNRFRDELARGASRQDAVATTIATAGRAITFSGLTVAVGLSAMLFFQGTFMASMGAAGAIVVAVAVIYGLTFLPALLAIIGPSVNRLRLPFGGRARAGTGFWHGLATWVMRRPVVVLIPTVLFLVIAATPFSQLRLANGNVDMLPTRLEARQGYDRLIADFPGQGQTTYDIVVSYPSGSPLTPDRIADQYALDKRIAQIPGINKVTSIYDLGPTLGLYEYEQMYAGGVSGIPASAQPLMAGTVGKTMVLIQATSAADPYS
ncbi:MAG TPA: MMPL family transporter, partial [Candidatus Dormibacteraeota bacterium]|nr:MMPL family transporter [Candidatus Dormibacteraeota bacterium]